MGPTATDSTGFALTARVIRQPSDIDGSRKHVHFAVINATNARETPHALTNIFKDLRNFPRP
jgi:hypothetical protein